MYHKETNASILASIKGRCAVAEYSSKTVSGYRQWTADYCNTFIVADVPICQKPITKLLIVICQVGYHQCGDKTCILTLYACDSVNDCLDGNDEAQCDPIVLQEESFQNGSLHLPCLVYCSCN